MKRIIEIALIAFAAVSGIMWMSSGMFMIKYFRTEMVAEYGEQFTTVVEDSFAIGWMIPCAMLMLLERMYWKIIR